MVPLSPRKSDAAMAPADQVSRADTLPAVSSIGYAAFDPQTDSEDGGQNIAGKPSCIGQSRDGNCISFQLPKVRMVRVAIPRAASVGHQANSAKPGVAANSRATEVDKGIAKTKMAQRSEHRPNQRRKHPLHSTRSHGEVRIANWASRGYARGGARTSRQFW